MNAKIMDMREYEDLVNGAMAFFGGDPEACSCNGWKAPPLRGFLFEKLGMVEYVRLGIQTWQITHRRRHREEIETFKAFECFERNACITGKDVIEAIQTLYGPKLQCAPPAKK